MDHKNEDVVDNESFTTVHNLKENYNYNRKHSLNMSDFSLIGKSKSSLKNNENCQISDIFEKALIFKTKDDLRQDNFCLQLIFLFKKMFSISQIPLFVKF